MKHKSALFAFLSILATGFIFYNSLKTSAESAASSSVIVDFIVNQFSRFNKNLDYATLTVLIRKLAHVAEFFIQSLFISLFYFFKKSKFSARAVHVMFFGLLTACTDELIQNFVYGRGSLVIDIWIDFAGVILAALFYLIISGLSRR